VDIFLVLLKNLTGDFYMLTIYFVTLLGVIAAQVSPGPNLIAVASVSLAQGRRAAFFHRSCDGRLFALYEMV